MKPNKTLMMLLPLMVAGLAGAQSIHTTLNGENVTFPGTQPMMSSGRVLVPVRGIFEQMGCTVDWDPTNRMVYASDKTGKRVEMHIGDRRASVDGNWVPLEPFQPDYTNNKIAR